MIGKIIEIAPALSGGFGLVGSMALAWPLLNELRDRKLWDLLRRFKEQKALAPSDQLALQSIRERLLDARLGRYENARWFTLGGLAALGVAFLFLLVDAANRSGR